MSNNRTYVSLRYIINKQFVCKTTVGYLYQLIVSSRLSIAVDPLVVGAAVVAGLSSLGTTSNGLEDPNQPIPTLTGEM